MLHPRSAHSVVQFAGIIYAVAGSGPARPVSAVERYDGKKWVDETTLPGDGLNAAAAVVLNGLIYVIGGFQGVSNLPTAEVRTYDPTTKRWAVGAPLPRPRGGPLRSCSTARSMCSVGVTPARRSQTTPSSIPSPTAGRQRRRFLARREVLRRWSTATGST